MSEPGDETIFYLDQITVKPGQAKAFLDVYMREYAPKAEARGLQLAFRWLSPPLFLTEQSNQVFIIWKVQGVEAWWRATRLRRGDPALVRFWSDIAQMIVARQRLYLADVTDIESLCDV